MGLLNRLQFFHMVPLMFQQSVYKQVCHCLKNCACTTSVYMFIDVGRENQANMRMIFLDNEANSQKVTFEMTECKNY